MEHPLQGLPVPHHSLAVECPNQAMGRAAHQPIILAALMRAEELPVLTIRVDRVLEVVTTRLVAIVVLLYLLLLLHPLAMLPLPVPIIAAQAALVPAIPA